MSTASAKRPVVAIVGSADSNRATQLSLRDADRAPDACEALGRELAAQGLDIIVYSSEVSHFLWFAMRPPRARRAVG